MLFCRGLGVRLARRPLPPVGVASAGLDALSAVAAELSFAGVAGAGPDADADAEGVEGGLRLLVPSPVASLGFADGFTSRFDGVLGAGCAAVLFCFFSSSCAAALVLRIELRSFVGGGIKPPGGAVPAVVAAVSEVETPPVERAFFAPFAPTEPDNGCFAWCWPCRREL